MNVDAEGAFDLRWTPGSSVPAADAHAVLAAVPGVTGARLQPMLVEVVDACMSPGARAALPRRTGSVSAVALVRATVADRVMGTAPLRGQERPHRHFTSMEDAGERPRRSPVPQTLEGSPL